MSDRLFTPIIELPGKQWVYHAQHCKKMYCQFFISKTSSWRKDGCRMTNNWNRPRWTPAITAATLSSRHRHKYLPVVVTPTGNTIASATMRQVITAGNNSLTWQQNVSKANTEPPPPPPPPPPHRGRHCDSQPPVETPFHSNYTLSRHLIGCRGPGTLAENRRMKTGKAARCAKRSSADVSIVKRLPVSIGYWEKNSEEWAPQGIHSHNADSRQCDGWLCALPG